VKQRILGIDPALGTTGYGVIDIHGNTIRLVDAGVIRSRPADSLESRLIEIYDGISEIIAELRPTCVAIEELYSHYDRPTTAILMGHARGAILLAVAKHDLRVHPYAATRVKKTLTGNGHAPKSQMQMAIKLQLGLSVFPEPADVADALAIALTHHHNRAAQALFDQ
jgi:crossover junction endodeoxyribonuclease RuvC